MFKIQILGFCVTALLSGGSLASEAALVAKKPVQLESLPKATLHTHPGYRLQEIQGSIVLVDFWATWCEPCKEALPIYEKLFKKYEKQGFKVIAFSTDDKAEEAVQYLKKNPVSFPVYFDQDRKYTEKFDVVAVPTLFVLDKNRTVLESYQGYTPKKLKALEQKLEILLAP